MSNTGHVVTGSDNGDSCRQEAGSDEQRGEVLLRRTHPQYVYLSVYTVCLVEHRSDEARGARQDSD